MSEEINETEENTNTENEITADSKLKQLALQVLGISEDFGNFDNEDDEVIKKINFGYESLIKQTLSEYRWSFATITEKLITKTNTTDNKYSYAYTLPQDFLVLINPFTSKERVSLIQDYEISGSFYTNSDSVYLNYIKRVDTSSFPDYFIQFIKYKIALDKCMLLTGDTELLQFLNTKTTEQYIIAKRLDAKQQPDKITRSNPYYNARF